MGLEITLKLKHFREVISMPLCGFNPKMLQGLTLFAQGLYEAVLQRASERGISIEKAMEIEIEEMNVFLGALEEKYQELRKAYSIDEAMRKLVEWTESQNKLRY
jgi:hypothetical protein